MANLKIPIDALSETVMKELNEYADVACDEMKEAVKSSSTLVKNQIKATAPRATGAYAKSWSTKNTRETAHSLEVTVYSRNRYQLAHLLEHGHAKRGGGRVPGRSHIAPAEQAGIDQLEKDIERSLRHGSFAIEDLEIFENVAYIMAYHADHSIPDNIDDWLDQFEMFSIYEILPEILELWGSNLVTDVASKKNSSAAAVK